MMVKMILRRGLFGLLAAFVGCRAYEPSPVDWTAECETWLKEGELMFASLDDVARVAVVGNMQLNQLRLRRATSEKAARATGWWDDPEADVDLLRVVNPTDNPLAGGVSLSLTLPLSGVKGLERKAAEAYSAADAADIIAVERETAVAARSAAVRFLSAGETVRTLRAFDAEPRVVSALIAALTHALATSFAGKVRVNSVSPGWIDTAGRVYSGADAEQHPAGRVGNPLDIANVVLFLASDKAGFITGENVCVDGGMTRQMIYHNDFGWTLTSA